MLSEHHLLEGLIRFRQIAERGGILGGNLGDKIYVSSPSLFLWFRAKLRRNWLAPLHTG